MSFDCEVCQRNLAKRERLEAKVTKPQEGGWRSLFRWLWRNA